MMNAPRCGFKDKTFQDYVLEGSRWNKNHLTWRVTKYPSSSWWTNAEVDTEMENALQFWSDNANLKFSQYIGSGKPDIEIRFEAGSHGDYDPFDGRGGTLAHAFFPQFGGDAHFDDHEYWTKSGHWGTNLLQVSAHEFGHSLGLSHSRVQNALMAPFYAGYTPNMRLHDDDVRGIQALYGRPAGPKPKPTTTTPKPSQVPDLCTDSKIDTIFATGDDKYYVFQGDHYWQLAKGEDSVMNGYPRKIADDWPGLPNDIDAAVTWTENKQTYFFKGDTYWKFNNKKPQPGYPRKISVGWPGIPNDVNAGIIEYVTIEIERYFTSPFNFSTCLGWQWPDLFLQG